MSTGTRSPAAGHTDHADHAGHAGHVVGPRTEAADVVDRFFTLVTAGDLPAAVALYADDATLHIPEGLPYGGVYTGPQGVLQALGTVYGKADVEFARGPVQPLGHDRAVAFNRFDRIALKHAPQGEARIQLAEIYTVHHGRITEAAVWYWDTAALLPVLAGF